MPYEIRKVSRGKYEVSNPESGEIHAKHTSLAKAKAQVRLLSAKHGGSVIQPINRKPPAFKWEGGAASGGDYIQPINRKMLPFF
jgi:hypothetical protein